MNVTAATAPDTFTTGTLVEVQMRGETPLPGWFFGENSERPGRVRVYVYGVGLCSGIDPQRVTVRTYEVPADDFLRRTGRR